MRKNDFKKYLCAAAAVCITVFLSACAFSQGTTQAEGSEDEISYSSDINDYEDNLEGLAAYFKANGMAKGSPTEMLGEIIGAEKGVKYSETNNRGSVISSVELYEYNIDEMNDTAKSVWDSVEKNGKIEILGYEVEAKISGKYLMIYQSAGENAQEETEKAENLLKEFAQR